MLEARNICLEVDNEGESLFLLSDVNFCIPRGHFVAIVGPSGCGKTTLLKAIAGIKETTSGSFFWEGRDLAEDGDFEPYEIGYVPQFSIAYEELTVDENVESSARLRVDADDDELDDIIDSVLEETGLSEIADRPVKLLSGGQKRRLALAMELVSRPRILLCDEVTSGLDPRSEREIVELLHKLSMKDGRIVISVTHSLAQLSLYDSIIVMVRGNLAYHGSPELMIHYFGEQDFEQVYPKLAMREPDEWRQSWLKHRVDYYQRLERKHLEKFSAAGITPPPAEPRTEEPEEVPQPSFFTQFSTLLKRRFTILFRDRTQLWLQVAMIVIFPILVALFSSKGQDQLLQLTDNMGNDLVADGSDFTTVVAAVTDKDGNIKRLNNYYIKFQVEGEGRILGGAGELANPAPVKWGTAPVVVQSTLNAGKIRITASVLFEGEQMPVSGVLEFESKPASQKMIYKESEAKQLSATSESSFSAATAKSDADLAREREASAKNAERLKEVEKQQTDFGEKR